MRVLKNFSIFLVLLVVFFGVHAIAQTDAVHVDSEGNVGINTNDPSQKLDVQGDMMLSGVLIGTSRIGGNAAQIRGLGTGGSTANFSFKYDKANFGDSAKAIQIFNAATGIFKTFIIDHPMDDDKYLVHATLEGPEGAVYYRGTARLTNGQAEIQLPRYFEALTKQEDRTIILTNIDGFDRLAVKRIDGQKVKNGRFVVIAENTHSNQEFDWEVKATRADGPDLIVEPAKADMGVGRVGPYTFSIEPKSSDGQKRD